MLRITDPGSTVDQPMIVKASAPGDEHPFASRCGNHSRRVDPSTVKIGIGMTLRNKSRYLPEALESLLNQTYKNFGLVLVDDQSSDQTEPIARQYEQRDERVTYFRNESHLGMTATWRRAFELVRQVYPAVQYFAWASDHDLWAPTWLETMLRVLESNPEVVLTYPRTKKISEAGVANPDSEPSRFETIGITDLRQRWIFMCQRLFGAGNMVYGLARVDAIKRAGVFRDVILPDRLLMAELTLQGQFLQVPEVLWFRRQIGISSLQRQRRTLFGPCGAPVHAYLPWPLVHASRLMATYGLKRFDRSLSRAAVMQMCLRYLRTQSAVQYHKFHLRCRRRLRAYKRWGLEFAESFPQILRRERDSPRRLRKSADEVAPRMRNSIERILHRWLKRMLTPVIIEPLAEQISSQSTEVRRLRKSLNALHQEVAAAISHVSQNQDAMLARDEEIAAAISHVSQKQDAMSARNSSLESQLERLRIQLVQLNKRAWREPWPDMAKVANDEQFHELAQKVIGDGRTLLGFDRLFILWQAVRNVYGMRLPAAEVGCYHGGGSYFLAAAFTSLLGAEVEFHVFDTFKGHPAEMVTEHDPVHNAGMFGDVDFEDVSGYLASFRKLILHKGEFSQVVKSLSDKQFSLVHVDTDLHRSTLLSLEYFGPRIAPGGIIVVDDYGAPKCPGVRDAIQAYLGHARCYIVWELPSEQTILIKMS